jgi:hypothetical protein
MHQKTENPGLKYDDGNPRWDLVPSGSFARTVDVLTFGAKKYGPNSWQKVKEPEARYYAAAMRHLESWRTGEILDKESGIPHLAHVMCNMAFLMHFDNERK